MDKVRILLIGLKTFRSDPNQALFQKQQADQVFFQKKDPDMIVQIRNSVF